MTKSLIAFLLVLLSGIFSYATLARFGFSSVVCSKTMPTASSTPQYDTGKVTLSQRGRKIFEERGRKSFIIPAKRNGLRSVELGILYAGADADKEFDDVPPQYATNHSPRNISGSWILKPRVTTSPMRYYFMVFFVKSAVPYSKRRDLIRRTWGSVTTINGKRFAVVFVVGKTTNETLQDQLRQEHELNWDILQGDVADDYRMLPDKTLSAFQWATYDAKNISDYFAFTDDDCVVNLAKTYDYFSTNQRSFEESNSMHCGFRYSNGVQPMRTGKYGLSISTYPWKVLPPFCHGGFTVLPSQLVVDIYGQALVTDRYDLHLEDVYILGILRTKLGRGKSNIKIAGLYSEMGSSINYYMGPFVWHINDNAILFKHAWRVVYNLMSVKGKEYEHQGYWPSADTLVATISSNAEKPTDDQQEEFFKIHFGILSNRPTLPN